MRYCISSVQAKAAIHTHFWEGLQTYAEANGAEIVLLPMIGESARQDWTPENIHPAFRPYLEYKRRRLNSNVAIEQFNLRPAQIDPLTGLDRFAQQGTSLVFASPKQRLRPIAHSNQKFPKFLATTGAVTRPNYATSNDVSAERRRLGDIARRDHTYGFIVVEVENDKLFHLRHVRANTRGEFTDLGVFYSGKKTKVVRADAMVLGDFHVGNSDTEVLEATYEMISALKPKRVVVHDFFDGHSVSHHNIKKPVQEFLIQVFDKDHGYLEAELKLCYDTLKKLSALTGEVVVVFSNHHAFLHRYLEEARFHKDPHNVRIAAKLFSYMAEKDYNDPVQAGILMFGKLPKVRFLREDEDFKIKGFQLAAHGDKSDALGYGSMMTKESAWGKSISGHVHQAQILRNTYTVGTCLSKNMFYMRGYPSAWTNSHALLYETGTVQLINIFDGKWRLFC